MGKIMVMNNSLANKIAAGEVVERPASVVKELVENAIDANATKIDIIMEKAGIMQIKVIDNGNGMDKEDALLAFSRHATSKLTNESDLFRIMTLGFRGEALPSIAAVSDCVLSTSDGKNTGTLVHFRGGKLIEQGLANNRKGTEITVKSLFFNTPARLKYLRSENTELSYTVDFMNKLALANPHIAFKLLNDGKVLLETFGDNNLLHVISSIYGLEVAKKIKTCDYKDHFLSLKLYFSEPEVNRTTKNYITLVVNKRIIKNYTLTNAILEGYETYLPIKRYPVVVLDLTLDPLLIDVNVHPAKLEVRLSNEEHIRTVIVDLIQKQLKELSYVPKISIRNERVNQDIIQEQQSFSFQEGLNQVNIEEKEVYSFTEEERALELHEEKPNIEVPNKLDIPITDNEKKLEKTINRRLPKLYYIGQLKGTYLLAQNEEGLYMIDQHAAQERINFEYYLKHFSQKINEYYELLIPLTFDFSVSEALIIENNLDLLNDLNIVVEKFGLSSFIVQQVPNYFKKGNEYEILKTIFDYLINNKKVSNEELFKDLAITLSCKKSIKANHYINQVEVEKLLSDLEKCENPYTCPHGRPVIIHMSYSEIEHLFKRTM
ncbi:MAG TPA: DNA mismatch repair endonuclease MutL [Haloplasmataceae bacterium]